MVVERHAWQSIMGSENRLQNLGLKLGLSAEALTGDNRVQSSGTKHWVHDDKDRERPAHIQTQSG